MQLREGSELQSGKYRIVRVLGQGGFGITYLAEHVYFDKKVAIKEFFPKDFCGRDATSHLTLGTQNNAETVARLKERFLKEARNIARLDHPGIVKIHDIFEENNTAYYVMDYIEGENLNEMMKRTGPLPEAKAVEYIRKVGDALEYIHSRHMTHFDVKPANIMVRRSDDQTILIDFGLSKQYDAQGEATTTLMQGVSQGYSPIEMYTPGAITSFSPQTDIYSLGATLYYLLTGNVPPAPSMLISKREELKLPKHINSRVKNMVMRAMAISESERPKCIKDWWWNKEKCKEERKDNEERKDLTEINTGDISSDVTRIIDESVRNNLEVPSNTDAFQTNETEDEIGYSKIEIEPTKWAKFVTNISSTNRLTDTYSIPNSRKLAYLFCNILLFILSLPLGWVFWIILLTKLRGALKKLFFPNNIYEFDNEYDYSTAKCWGILSIPIVFIIIEIGFVIIINHSYHKLENNRELKEYISDINDAIVPCSVLDGFMNFVELKGDSIIYYCQISDDTVTNREDANQLIADLLLDLLVGCDIEYHKILKRDDPITYIVRFKNNVSQMHDIIVPQDKIDQYKTLNENDRLNQFLTAYLELMKQFTPRWEKDEVALIDITPPSKEKYINFVFYAKDGNVNQYKASIEEFLHSYLNQYIWNAIYSCTDGVTYQINSKNYKTAPYLLRAQYQAE